MPGRTAYRKTQNNEKVEEILMKIKTLDVQEKPYLKQQQKQKNIDLILILKEIKILLYLLLFLMIINIALFLTYFVKFLLESG